VTLRVLAIDPGAKPGFCYTEDSMIVARGWEPDGFAGFALDELVIEGQFAGPIYRNGRKVRVSRKSQQTLSFTAGRLFERFHATRKYSISPDQWRRVLWPGAVRLTKPVVLARLAVYGDLVADIPKTHRGDVLEAIGIAMAWYRLTVAQKEQYRVE
jgi:hypothetical protein